MRQIKWILDPGHGGMAFGHYVTPGKRSPEVPPGIYEGEWNRDVIDDICLINYGSPTPLSFEVTAPGPLHVSLTERVEFVNDLPFKARDMALISIHANAAPGKGWQKASGSRLFLSKRASGGSERLAAILTGQIRGNKQIPYGHRPLRYVNHTITTRVKCPAVLVECGFMTHKADATWLATEGASVWADVIFRTMCIYQEGLE